MTTTPTLAYWMHHYNFKDWYIRDSRHKLNDSEIGAIERQHGPMMYHWLTPVFVGNDVFIDEDNSGGAKS